VIETLIPALQKALATDGLYLLFIGTFLGGLVRGFSGFGTAMVFMPFAGTVLPPVWALTTMIIFDVLGPLPNVPRALREGHPRDVLRLGVGAFIALPVGLFFLSRVDPEVFRWTVSVVSLILLTLLITGWRFKGRMTRPLVFSTGALGGLLCGVSGLAGPPVIMFYMSSRHAISIIRANILLYLLLVDFMTLGFMALTGILELIPVVIGSLLVIPYLLANVIGAALFRPEREKLYRVLAYTLIGVAALSSLPVWR